MYDGGGSLLKPCFWGGTVRGLRESNWKVSDNTFQRVAYLIISDPR